MKICRLDSQQLGVNKLLKTLVRQIRPANKNDDLVNIRQVTRGTDLQPGAARSIRHDTQIVTHIALGEFSDREQTNEVDLVVAQPEIHDPVDWSRLSLSSLVACIPLEGIVASTAKQGIATLAANQNIITTRHPCSRREHPGILCDERMQLRIRDLCCSFKIVNFLEEVPQRL